MSKIKKMSLDVNLVLKGKITYDDGKTFVDHDESVYEANITHNLAQMAREADIYFALWRPDEKGFLKAKDISPILEKGLKDLKNNKSFYKTFNASNGWGTYKQFLPWVSKYLEACKDFPEAYISTRR